MLLYNIGIDPAPVFHFKPVVIMLAAVNIVIGYRAGKHIPAYGLSTQRKFTSVRIDDIHLQNKLRMLMPAHAQHDPYAVLPLYQRLGYVICNIKYPFRIVGITWVKYVHALLKSV